MWSLRVLRGKGRSLEIMSIRAVVDIVGPSVNLWKARLDA